MNFAWPYRHAIYPGAPDPSLVGSWACDHGPRFELRPDGTTDRPGVSWKRNGGELYVGEAEYRVSHAGHLVVPYDGPALSGHIGCNKVDGPPVRQTFDPAAPE